MIKRFAMSFCAVALLSMLVIPKADATVGTLCEYITGNNQPGMIALDTVHGTVWVSLFTGNQVIELNLSTARLFGR